MSTVSMIDMFSFLLNFFGFAYRYSSGVTSPERHVRTRLYFTSESHVHSLLSTLRYGSLCDVSDILFLIFFQPSFNFFNSSVTKIITFWGYKSTGTVFEISSEDIFMSYGN